MATTTRPRKPAPGQRPASSTGKAGLNVMWGRAKKAGAKRWRRTSRDHPLLGLVVYLAVGVISVVALLVGLTAEMILFRLLGFLVAALGGLGALAIKQARHMEQAGQDTPRVRPQGAGSRKPPPPPRSKPTSPPPAANGVPKCTATGRSIDDCDCNTKHIRTQDGADYYRQPVGSPIGKPNKKPKVRD